MQLQLREFAAAGRYIQGPGALAQLWPSARTLGRRAAMIADARVLGLLDARLTAGAGAGDRILPFASEITEAAIAALVGSVPAAEVVIAVGGGKALDAGKAVALALGRPVMTVPTIASTDAPASRGIAIYDEDHRLTRVAQLPVNPQIVLVDTAVIAAAPADFLRAGIGDALAKKFEAEAALAGGGLNKHGTRPLQAGLIIADGCYRVLRRHGAAALQAAARGLPDAALEATVEACFLLSAMGFENTGLSMAHSVTRGLVTARQVSGALHGFHVAYGLLVQFATEGRDDGELADLRGYLSSVGLPRTLSEMGMKEPGAEDLEAMADRIMTSPHLGNVPHPVDRAAIRTALERVERFV